MIFIVKKCDKHFEHYYSEASRMQHITFYFGKTKLFYNDLGIVEMYKLSDKSWTNLSKGEKHIDINKIKLYLVFS